MLLLLLSEHLDIIDITDSRRFKPARIARPEIPTNRQPVRQGRRLILLLLPLLLLLRCRLIIVVIVKMVFIFFIIAGLFVLRAHLLHGVLVMVAVILLLIDMIFFHFLIVICLVFVFVCLLVLQELDLVVDCASLLHPVLALLRILILFPLLLLLLTLFLLLIPILFMLQMILKLAIFFVTVLLVHGGELAVLHHALQVLKDHLARQKAADQRLNLYYRNERPLINLNVIFFIIIFTLFLVIVLVLLIFRIIALIASADKLLVVSLLLFQVAFIVLLLVRTDLHHLLLVRLVLILKLQQLLLGILFGGVLVLAAKFRLAHTVFKSDRAMLLEVSRVLVLLKLLLLLLLLLLMMMLRVLVMGEKGDAAMVLRVMPLVHNIVACIARFLLSDAVIVAKVRIGGQHGPGKILLMILLSHGRWRRGATHLLASVRPAARGAAAGILCAFHHGWRSTVKTIVDDILTFLRVDLLLLVLSRTGAALISHLFINIITSS